MGTVEWDPSEFEDLDQGALRSAMARAYRELPSSEVRALLEDARAEAEGRQFVVMGQLEAVNFRDWMGHEPPPRVSLWGNGYLPTRQAILLSGAGGIGKSLWAQCIVTNIALGLSFLGLETVRSRCLYITCEDDEDELWRRQRSICDAYGTAIDDLPGNLILVSLAGSDETALAHFDPKTGGMETTELWARIQGTVSANGVRFVVLDNATDFMAGDHNDLHQVAAFVNLLTGLAMRMDGSVLILHHPNKAGADWLGSVAWHNKVRSRLIIESGDDEGDPDRRTIRNPKANYGPMGGKIAFRWHAGAFVGDAELSAEARGQLESTARAASDNLIFLACLAVVTKQERAVSHSPSNTYAPTVFAHLPESKGIGKLRLEHAMNRLLTLGQIERGELPWRKPDRHQAVGLRLAAADAAVDGAADYAGDARQTPQRRAVNVAAVTPPPKGGEGAAPWGPAAPSLDEGEDNIPGWDD